MPACSLQSLYAIRVPTPCGPSCTCERRVSTPLLERPAKLTHVQETPDAVSGSMPARGLAASNPTTGSRTDNLRTNVSSPPLASANRRTQPILPKRSSRKRIKQVARRPLRKHHRIHRDMSFRSSSASSLAQNERKNPPCSTLVNALTSSFVGSPKCSVRVVLSSSALLKDAGAGRLTRSSRPSSVRPNRRGRSRYGQSWLN